MLNIFSWRSVELNHTIAQMPFWGGATWCTWRAVECGNLLWWIALGAVSALGLYAKLSNAFLLIVIAGLLLSTVRGRATLKTPGPWLVAIVFVILAAPIIRWLITAGFQPLAYAQTRSHEQSRMATLLFPANALLQALPMMLIFTASGLFSRGAVNCSNNKPARPERNTFLAIMATVPPLLSILKALADGSGLRASWVAPTQPLLPILLISKFEARLTDDVLTRL